MRQSVEGDLHLPMSMRFSFRIFLLCLCVLIACSSVKPFADITSQAPIASIPTPLGVYTGVSWLKPDEIVFVYAPQPDPSLNRGVDYPGLEDFQLFQYSNGSNKWTALSVVKPKECRIGWVSRPSRFPDGKLAFIYQCEPNASTRQQELRLLNTKKGQTQIFNKFPERFQVQSYSTNPTGSQVVLAEQGGSIDDKVFTTQASGPLKPYFVEFPRAASPSWSADGKSIAFIANTKLPTARDNPFTALLGIGDLLFYPWDLYTANADGANPRIILV